MLTGSFLATGKQSADELNRCRRCWYRRVYSYLSHAAMCACSRMRDYSGTSSVISLYGKTVILLEHTIITLVRQIKSRQMCATRRGVDVCVVKAYNSMYIYASRLEDNRANKTATTDNQQQQQLQQTAQ